MKLLKFIPRMIPNGIFILGIYVIFSFTIVSQEKKNEFKWDTLNITVNTCLASLMRNVSQIMQLLTKLNNIWLYLGMKKLFPSSYIVFNTD